MAEYSAVRAEADRVGDVGEDDYPALRASYPRVGHALLEDQLCTYTGEPGEESPDVLDAMVWAFSELMLTRREVAFY